MRDKSTTANTGLNPVANTNFRKKRQTHEPKDWEKLLYMMDSTTITLFDNILKGVGRHPKSGKKKGGMKVHTVMKYHVGVPMIMQLTSAAKHDHYLLKEVHLPGDILREQETGCTIDQQL